MPPGVVGKAILFAPHALAFPDYGPWTDTLHRPPPLTDLPDFADIGKAEPLQGIADRLPLRVEDARLEADMNPRLHRFATRTLLHQSWRLEIDRPAFGQDAETAGHLPVALLDAAEILAEAVLVHLLVGARVP